MIHDADNRTQIMIDAAEPNTNLWPTIRFRTRFIIQDADPNTVFLRVRFRNTKFKQNRTQIMIDAPEPNTNLTIRDAEPNTILTLRDAVPDTGLWFAIRLRPRSEAVFETPVHDVPSWWLCVRRREQCRHVKLPYCIYHMNSRSISIVRYALNLFLSGGKRGKRG